MIYSNREIRSLNFNALIEDVLKSGKPEETLFLVPTNRLARNLKKLLIDRMPGSVVSIINIETLTTLSLKILEDKLTFRELSDAGSAVMISHITSGMNFRYFKNYKGKFPEGSLDRIRNVIGEYKEHGITPELLRKEAALLEGSEKLKALDIADIYERYNQKNKSLKVYELGDIYANLNNLEDFEIKEAFGKHFPNAGRIIAAGFDEFTSPEGKILKSLSLLPGIDLFIEFDYFKFNPMIFSHLDKTASMLDMLELRRVEDISPDTSAGFITDVKERLFLNKGERTNKYSERLYALKAFNKNEEIELIAAEIKNLIVSENVKPGKICVAFNLVSEFTRDIKEKFEAYGIPANITDRPNVDASFPVVALINFFEITENNFYFKSILRALNSGFLSLDNINAENLKRIAADLKIVSGRENWKNKIRAEIYNQNSGNADLLSETRLKTLEKGLKDIGLLESLLKPFEKKLTPALFSLNFLELIKKLNIRDNLLSESFGMEEDNIKAFTAFLETVNEIMKLIEMEYGANAEFDFKFYLESIRTAASRARYNIKEKQGYGVIVTSVNEIRGLKYDYLFIGGMNDGIFPTRFQPEIFLSGSYRKAEIIHQTEERFHFYQALKVWKKRLYLTTSASDGKKELVESSFMKDFNTLFSTQEITSEKYRNYLFTNKGVQISVGKEEVTLTEELQQIFGKNFIQFVEKNKKIFSLRAGSFATESEFNGFLINKNGKVPEELAEYRAKQYSISRLENYARCPYKFFLDTVLKIEVVEEPTEDVEAMELGTIFHEIFFRFLTNVKKEGIRISGCDTKTFNKLKKKLFEIAEEEIEKFGISSPISFSEREKILGYDGNREQSVLYRFLEYERNQDSGYEPTYFEVSFGSTAGDGTDEDISQPMPVKAKNVMLRGKIDRVDVNDEENSFDVVDYKLSGKKPTLPELQSGISLQLPVYLYSVREILKSRNIEKTPNDMIIYSLKFSENNFGKDPVRLSRKKDSDKNELNEEIIETALGFIEEYVENISKGVFHLSKYENREKLVCGYCNYKSICRVTDLKEEN